jgi:hypothetical protein
MVYDESRRYFEDYPWKKLEGRTVYSYIPGTEAEGRERSPVPTIVEETRDMNLNASISTNNEFGEEVAVEEPVPRARRYNEDTKKQEWGNGEASKKDKPAMAGKERKKASGTEREQIGAMVAIDNSASSLAMMTFEREARPEQSTKKSQRRAPFCTSQLFDPSTHVPLLVREHGAGTRNTRETRQCLAMLCKGIKQLLTIWSDGFEDASGWTRSAISRAGSWETQCSWRQFTSEWYEVREAAESAARWMTRDWAYPKKSAAVKRQLGETITWLKALADKCEPYRDMMPVLLLRWRYVG